MSKENERLIKANLEFLAKVKDEEIDSKTKIILEFQQRRIEKLLSNQEKEKRNLVFIGDSSAGKTTVISSLLDLYINKGDYLLQAMPSDEGGRTTPCPTELLLESDKYFIRVENENRDFIEGALTAYFKQIAVDGSGDLSEEYSIIFDNKISDEIKEIFKNIETDSITLERIQELNLELEFDDLYEEFNENLQKDDILIYINKLLLKIKKGKNEKVFIPKKITIGLKKNTTNLSSNIRKIIDTRGISTDSSGSTLFCREDLEDYIKDDDNIIVYINKYPSLNNRIKQTFEKLSQNNDVYKGILERLIVLVNTKDKEVISKMDIDEILDEDEEYNEDNIYDLIAMYNKNIILEKFNEIIDRKYSSFENILNLSYESPNLLIYRSFAGKIKKGKKIFLKNKADSLNEIKCFNSMFDYIVEGEIKRINIELLESTDLAVSIVKNKVGVDEVIKKALYELEFKESLKQDIDNSINNFLDRYDKKTEVYLVKCSSNTILAYIRNNGNVMSRNGDFAGDIYGLNSDLKDELLKILIDKKDGNIKLLKSKLILDEEFFCIINDMAIDAIKVTVNVLFDAIQKVLKTEFVGLESSSFWREVYNGQVPKEITYGSSLNEVFKKYISKIDLKSYTNFRFLD